MGPSVSYRTCGNMLSYTCKQIWVNNLMLLSLCRKSVLTKKPAEWIEKMNQTRRMLHLLASAGMIQIQVILVFLDCWSCQVLTKLILQVSPWQVNLKVQWILLPLTYWPLRTQTPCMSLVQNEWKQNDFHLYPFSVLFYVLK